MTAAQPSADIRCRSCGDVIGVYEPMIVMLGGERLLTSRAAASGAFPDEATHYHAACARATETEQDTRPG